MPSTLPIPEPTICRNVEVTAPDWNVVPFEVGCARCGRDLRGLTDPKCPACGLEFDWSKAVPIEQLLCRKCGYHLCGLRETRCPECGESFTWEQMLDDYHRRQKPTFEYRWRDQPFRSLVYTWWLALRPWKLWRTIDIHDPPRPGPLLFHTLLTFALYYILIGLGRGLSLWCWNNYGWTGKSVWAWGGPDWSGFVGYLRRGLERALASEELLLPVTWAAMAFPALLIFQQSMRKHRVRTTHVLRVWVYSVPQLLPIAAAVAYAWDCILAVTRIPMNPDLEWLIAGPVWLHVLICLSLAYRVYLRIPHAWGVAIASQVIAILIAITLLAVVFVVLG